MALSKISGTTGIADATITSAKLADFTAAVDLNGVELLLDADADTSISADTDDQIDIKIANADHLKILSSSGDTVLKPMVDGKDIIFQQFDGNKIFCIDDGNFVSVGGNATAAGQIRIYEDTDNGSHYSGFTVGNLTASVAYQLPNADGSSGQALITDGSGVLSFTTLSANTPSSADGQALGSASLEWSDLFLADGSTIQFGADQDVTLTHVADTGLLLSATDQLQFGDSGTFIHQSADGVLDLVSDTEIELNATTIDVNGNLDVSGTITSAGIVTGTGFTAGSAVLAEAELELLDGLTAGTAIASKVVTTDANIDTSGQRNLTISGELDAATGDFSGAIDVAGTANLDVVDIDGAVDMASTLQVDGAITSGGVITGTAFTAGSAVLAEAELELLDGLTAGTAIASKVVTTDANIDTTGQRNLTISGELDAATGDFSGAVDVAGTTTVVALTASGLVTAGAKIDLNGTELILDADGDTSLTADTDDQIHIRIAGADDFKFIANHFNVLSGSNVTFANNSVAYFGDGNNLQISSDGTNALIAESGGSGNLNIAGQTVRLMNAANDEIMLEATNDGGVDIRHNNVTKLVTISSGVTITGNAGATTLNGIPFFAADSSIYTHNVSGTDDTAAQNAGYGVNALDAITTGDHNSAFGFKALSGNTTGARNVGLGRSALEVPDTENDNIAIGYNAMAGAVAGGQQNVAIGSEALDALTSADDNVAIGHNAGGALTTGGENVIMGSFAVSTGVLTGAQNVAIGRLVGQDLTSATRNVIMGWSAAKQATTGADNVIIGHDANGTGILTGASNTIMGADSAKALTSGEQNVAIGKDALLAATSDSYNVVIGTSAGKSIIGGANNNTLIGIEAGRPLTTGDNNVAVGSEALGSASGATTEGNNLAIGANSMKSANLNGAEFNVAVGGNTLDAITSADKITAVGYEAGSGHTTGANCVFIGYQAGLANTSGASIVAIGANAYDLADTESNNIAIGNDAMHGSVAGGEFNVAIGTAALDALTTADNNVAVGDAALTDLTTGGKNTACGYEALANVVGGVSNVGLGHFAGGTITSGSNNICIGIDSGISGSPGGALGTGSNSICFGDENIANCNIQVDWTVASDKRDKTDVSAIDIGLGFINKLEPVTYRWDKRSKYDNRITTGEHKEAKLDIGFLAQDVEVLENEYGYKKEDKTNLTTNLSEDGVQYGIQYSKFVPILVKAVQELSSQVEELKDKIKVLEE